MQVETPLNSTICTLRDLGNYNKKTFCNLCKARLTSGVVSFSVPLPPPPPFVSLVYCLFEGFGVFFFVYGPVKKVFFQPQKIQQFTCVCFSLRYSQDRGCLAEMSQNICSCWSAALQSINELGSWFCLV